MNPERLLKPEISIIVPVYNSALYLEKCLTSLTKQTLKEIEIICINDGSKDNSLQILEEFSKADSRIKIINQKNSGPAFARNQGLHNSNGKYIMFCDSDDWYEKSMCKTMHEAIIENNVDIVECEAHFHESDKFHKRSIQTIINTHKIAFSGKINLTEKDKNRIFVVLWNKIFKSELIDKYKITFPSGYEFDDDSFIHQYLSYSESYYGLEKKLYNYLIRSNSIMSNLDLNHKIEDFTGAFAHTVNSLINNHKFEEKFVYQAILNKLEWFFSNIEDKNIKTLCNKLADRVISLMPDETANKNILFLKLKKRDYSYVKKIVNGNNTERKKIFGLTYYKKIIRDNKLRLYILGIQIFKKKTELSKQKIYILGVRVR